MIDQSTIDELLRSARVIKSETTDGANTANRVGTMFIDIINQLKNSGGISGGGGDSPIVNYKRLDNWDSYEPSMADWVLSAALGVDLYNRIKNNSFFEKVQVGGTEAEPTFAVRLKPEYSGLYSEGFLSAYGLNGSGSGSGTGGGGISEITKKMVTDALGFTPLDENRFTKGNIKDALGIYDWALEANKPDYSFDEINGILSFSQLPNLYWANLPLQEQENTNTSPIFGSVQIGDAIITWNPEKQCLFVNKGFVSESFISAYGINENGSGGGGLITDRLDAWEDYDDDKATWVLSALLGVELHLAVEDLLVSHASLEERFSAAMLSISVSLADIDERLRALGIAVENAGEKLTFVTNGNGNAVTSITKNGTTVTAKKDISFQETISDLATIRSNAATAFGWGNHASAGYVTALGTNGNYLTYTKGGSTNNITVPYATTSGKLSITGTFSAWGQTYFANGLPNSISGNMTSVGTISANGDNTITKSGNNATQFIAKNGYGTVALLAQTNRGVFDSTSGRWLIGTNGTDTYLSETGKFYFSSTNNEAYIEYKNGAFHFSKGIYSDSFISAYGLNGNASSLSFDTGNSNTNPTLKADASGRLRLAGTLGGTSSLYLGVQGNTTNTNSNGEIVFAHGTVPESKIYGRSGNLYVYGYGGVVINSYAGAEMPVAVFNYNGLEIQSGKTLKIGSTTLNEDNLKKLLKSIQ